MTEAKVYILRALGKAFFTKNADISQRPCLSTGGSVQHIQLSTELLKRGRKEVLGLSRVVSHISPGSDSTNDYWVATCSLKNTVLTFRVIFLR